MSTTELFVEHLIAGALSLLSLILFIFTIGGFDLAIIQQILAQKAILSVIGIAIMYPLGIFTDNLADAFLKNRNNKIRKRHSLKEDGITIAKLLINLKDDNVSNYFNYTRSRIRIARSAVLNFLVLTIMLIFFFLCKGHYIPGLDKVSAILITLLIGSLLTFYAFWNWNNIADNYHKMTRRVWEEAIDQSPSSDIEKIEDLEASVG